jgi:(S)-sulfolactate dehydrogenase
LKIIITEFMDVPAVELLKAQFNTTYDATLVERRTELLAVLADCDALIVRNRTEVNAEVLAAAPSLKVVGRLGVGLDNIDIAACKARGVEVIPATGANALAVAEYVICTAMMLLRGTYFSSSAVADGAWPRGPLSNGREMAGKTLGIVGFGGIGQMTARLARGLGMQTIACDPMIAPDADVWTEQGTKCVDLTNLFQSSDVVTLHLPLMDSTRNLVDAARLATMKPSAILINTARGGIVDEAALADALKNKRLGGAALDVFDVEPLKADSPLAGCPNLILTPHIAGVTSEANTRVSSLIANRVAAFLRK